MPAKVPIGASRASLIAFAHDQLDPVAGTLAESSRSTAFSASYVDVYARDSVPSLVLSLVGVDGSYRSDRKAARTSSEKSCGSSQAGKWPPASASWK